MLTLSPLLYVKSSSVFNTLSMKNLDILRAHTEFLNSNLTLQTNSGLCLVWAH